MSSSLIIRDARTGDEDAIYTFLRDFAEFEKLTQFFHVTREIIAHDFLGESRRVQCEIAEWDDTPAGLMIWLRTYRTFQAAPVIFLEDLYVDPKFRRRGIGRAFLKHLAQRALAERAMCIDWIVLDWNSHAIEFYSSIGAPVAPEWRMCRLTGDALAKLAKA